MGSVIARQMLLQVLFMGGGCDSFNLLMPSGGCGEKDMFSEYTKVRGDVAIGREGMVNISSSPPGSQPCDTFGVHKSLDFVAELYELGDAAFVANIGNLVEPVTRETYEDGSAKLPPQLFAHNFAVKAAKTCARHGQEAVSKGVLGRMLDAMSEQAFNTSAYSIARDAKMIEAESAMPDMIDRRAGAVRFQPAIDSGDGPCELCEHINAVLRPESKSAFGDTIALLTASSFERSEKVHWRFQPPPPSPRRSCHVHVAAFAMCRQYVMCTVCRSQRLSSLSSTVPSPRTRSASSSSKWQS